MITTRQRQALLCGAAWSALVPAIALGVEWESASYWYDRGVNAYFDGRAGEAESLLTKSLGLADDDPRAFYFRGLSRLKLGYGDGARHDMGIGAALEAERGGRFAVGKALERVQGGDRLILEKYRCEARRDTAAVATAAPERPARVAIVEQIDFGPVRERIVIPLDQLLQSGEPRPLTADEIAREIEAASQAPALPSEPSSAPATEPEESGDNPFEDDTSASEDEAPSVEAESPPATESESVENPFGDY